MIEENPAETRPYVSMECTHQQGLLVYEILGYRLNSEEREHIGVAFPRTLQKHGGDLLNTMCELYVYDVLNMRRLKNANADPRYRRTGIYDVAMVRFWEKVKEAELIEKFQQGLTVSYLHYMMYTVEPALEDEQCDTGTKHEASWNPSDTGECPRSDLGSQDNGLDEGW